MRCSAAPPRVARPRQASVTAAGVPARAPRRSCQFQKPPAKCAPFVDADTTIALAPRSRPSADSSRNRSGSYPVLASTRSSRMRISPSHPRPSPQIGSSEPRLS
jgi:hypothetical protein